MDKKYFSVPELATYLSVPPRTIRSWVHKGQLPFYKFNRCLRFEIAKIERWEKSKEELKIA